MTRRGGYQENIRMHLQIDLHYRLLYGLLSLCILVGLFSAQHASAEGVLPRRDQHRAQAVVAARRHYRRQFVNDTSGPPQTGTPTTSSGSTGEAQLGDFIDSLFNVTLAGILGGSGAPVQSSSSSAVEPTTSTTPLNIPVADDISTPTNTSDLSPSAAEPTTSTTPLNIPLADDIFTPTNTSGLLPDLSPSEPSSSSSATTQDSLPKHQDSLPTHQDSLPTYGVEAAAADQALPPTTTLPATTSNADPVETTSTPVGSLTLPTVPPDQTSSSTDAFYDVSPTPSTAGDSYPSTAGDSSTDPPIDSPTSSFSFYQPPATSYGSPPAPTPTTASTDGFAGNFQTEQSPLSTNVVQASSSFPAGGITDGPQDVTSAVTSQTGTSPPDNNDVASTSSPDSPGQNVILATSSSSASSPGNWLPATLVTAPAGNTNSPDLIAAASPTTSGQAAGTSAPSTPKIITPADGLPDTPDNSTLVEIGFSQSLNYAFVSKSSVTEAQIFEVLPIAISYALQIPGSDVTVRNLQPYPAASYTATVALLWIPSDLVDTLQEQILASTSRLYEQQDPTAEQLVNAIDPTIPLVISSTIQNQGSSTPGTSYSNGNSGLSNEAVDSGSLTNIQSQNNPASSSTTGKQVAIGFGVALAALGYGALMFLGAKRFRKQSVKAENDRCHHARVSSITGERPMSPFVQSYRSSGGSSGRNIRPQNISAPLMTENSLLL